jgi:hypothetical protein
MVWVRGLSRTSVVCSIDTFHCVPWPDPLSRLSDISEPVPILLGSESVPIWLGRVRGAGSVQLDPTQWFSFNRI